MQHIKGCCCYFRQGHFYPLCPPAVSLPLPFSSSRRPWHRGWNRKGRSAASWPGYLHSLRAFDPHPQISFYLSVHSFFFNNYFFFAACTFLCWGAYVSVKFLLCVIKCVYATVLCVIVELLLGLSQDYYSVSTPLLPFISIFSPSFIYLFIQQSS